jgi:hypothetical protein
MDLTMIIYTYDIAITCEYSVKNCKAKSCYPQARKVDFELAHMAKYNCFPALKKKQSISRKLQTCQWM